MPLTCEELTWGGTEGAVVTTGNLSRHEMNAVHMHTLHGGAHRGCLTTLPAEFGLCNYCTIPLPPIDWLSWEDTP